MRKITLLLLTAGCFYFSPTHAQFLKKLKEKANQVVDKKADDAANKALGIDNGQSATGNNGTQGPGNPGNSSSRGSNNPNNKGGAGLVVTPPDVKENLTTAETVFGQGKYSEARYAVQQAM
ncbi:MAG TPA: hypothetical protein VFL47_09370, partial [Flavisolibacter sp.]|nr:hypothetical protein [Flavisolibacter sp.]